MSFQNCLDEIQRAAGREFSDEELEGLFEELQQRARNQQAKNRLGDDAVIQAAEEIANEQQQAAIIAKRNEALNRVRRLEMLDFIRSEFADDPEMGFEALIVGVNRLARGGRFSADAQRRALAAKYVGGLLADLEREGLLPYINRGHLDRKIAQELWELDRPGGQPGVSGSKQAAGIARVVRKYQEAARIDANAAGAWIRKLPGYIVRQSHDMDRIRATRFEGWRDFIIERLDERTFDNVADRDEFLRGVYKGLSSGVHLRALGDAGPAGFKGPRNIAKALSQDRVLHFRTADDWFDYHERFGRGNLNEALLFGLERMGRTTGLMRAMGPNPEANFNQVFAEIKNDFRASPDAEEAFERSEKRLRQFLAEVDGSVNIPANRMGAQVSAGVRAVQSMSKLGAAVLSAISDIPIAASELSYQGQGMLSGMANQMAGLVDGVANARQKREIAAMLGVFFDGMSQNVLSRFDLSDGLPGFTTNSLRFFFKINGLQWWTDTMRASAAQAMGHRLALNKALPFTELEPDLQRVLGLFAIGENEWQVLRQASQRLADGREYLVPEAVAELPDDSFTGLLAGQKATKARLRNLRSELEDKLRSYYVDRSRFAVIEPDARTQRFMRRGTEPGTVFGEAARFFWQFKAFPVAVLQKSVGREIYGRGSNTLGEALRNGNGEMQGLAQLFLWTTLFGYGGMTAKDLAKGRTPRDPLDPRTMVAAALQGGALGIYGDFLFGEMKNRFGNNPLTTIAGPTAGAANDLLDLFGRVKAGEDPGIQAWRVLLNNTPFINLFYTRAALDYLILYQIQEALSPGYLRRLERRVREQNEQEFLIPPSQAA